MKMDKMMCESKELEFAIFCIKILRQDFMLMHKRYM